MAYTPQRLPVTMGTINPAYEILEGSALRDTPFMFTTQNLPIRERVSLPKTYPFVNGFRLVTALKALKPKALKHSMTNKQKTFHAKFSECLHVCTMC